MPTVAVCICTYLRPSGLARLLHAVDQLRLDDPAAVQVKVVVVDNDPAGAARPVVEQPAVERRWPVSYVVEPRRGIPYARNTAIACAQPFDLLAFLDDDETPEPAWLQELVRAQQRTGADVTTGPVLPRFLQEPPPWVVRGGFFDSARHATGTRMHFANTGNVLMTAELVTGTGQFSTDYHGGEDTHYFTRAHLAGYQIVWVDEARAHEWVPASRVRTGWLVRREFRRGNTLSRCLRDLEDSPRRRVKRVLHAGYAAGSGLLLALRSLTGRREHAVAALRRIAFAAGLVTGLLGHRYAEPARPPEADVEPYHCHP